MKFTQPSFTVPTGHRPAESCSHGWLDVRGRCVFCGHDSTAEDAEARESALSRHRRRQMRRIGLDPANVGDVLKYSMVE